jgi:dihydroorotate dehydrogenase
LDGIIDLSLLNFNSHGRLINARMSWFYRQVVRPVLFNYDSEEIHNRTIEALGFLSRQRIGCEMISGFYGMPLLPTRVFGIEFPNPVGLAAGMDKSAAAVPAWAAFGFGFSELGGVTWHPQPGNPQPRMFRIVGDEALVNRMGFNNPGAQEVAERLAFWKTSGAWPNHPVGLNLGKSKMIPIEQAAADYAKTFQALEPYGDFFVVNVSSPNTPNLRQLQDKTVLDELFAALNDINGQPAKPILVKVAPDLSFEALDEILEIAGPRRIAGIVATNTTIARPGDPSHPVYKETGGLSGKPLRQRSTEMIRHIYQRTEGKIPIIGVGGIFNAEDAWEKTTAGASLVQIYTGLVYEGPAIAREICDGLTERLGEHGFKSLTEAVGSLKMEFPSAPRK